VSQAEAHTDHEAAPPRGPRWLAGRLWLGARIVWRAIVHLIYDGGMTYAGHIAFMTLFSLFPFLIFLTTLAAELGQTRPCVTSSPWCWASFRRGQRRDQTGDRRG
jgi:hypothetical protein